MPHVLSLSGTSALARVLPWALWMAGMGTLTGRAEEPQPLSCRVTETQAYLLGGRTTGVTLQFHNGSDQNFEQALSHRLWGGRGRLAAPLTEPTPWKVLRIAPGQTVLETLELTLPEVRAPVRLEIRFNAADESAPAMAEAVLIPSPDFKGLFPAGAQVQAGIFDPAGQVFDLLSRAGAPVLRLDATAAPERFRGSLVVVAPLPPAQARSANVDRHARTWLQAGMPVIRLESVPGFPVTQASLQRQAPGAGRETVAGLPQRSLSEDAISQLQLWRLLQEALKTHP